MDEKAAKLAENTKKIDNVDSPNANKNALNFGMIIWILIKEKRKDCSCVNLFAIENQ